MNKVKSKYLENILRFLSSSKVQERVFVILASAVVLITFVVLYKGLLLEKHEMEEYLNNEIPIVVALFVMLATLRYFTLTHNNSFDVDLKELKEEKIQITQKIESENKLDIFHTIQLSLNELNQYYTINKGQARSSFRWSIFAIVTGFLTIVFGVWLHYFQNKVELSYLAGASGVILEFIGGAYFFVYKKSLEQVNFFFGQLIKIQDTMLAINIANNITIDDKKVDMHEKIIVSLLERSLK